MEIYNLDDVVTVSQLHSTVSAEIRPRTPTSPTLRVVETCLLPNLNDSQNSPKQNKSTSIDQFCAPAICHLQSSTNTKGTVYAIEQSSQGCCVPQGNEIVIQFIIWITVSGHIEKYFPVHAYPSTFTQIHGTFMIKHKCMFGCSAESASTEKFLQPLLMFELVKRVSPGNNDADDDSINCERDVEDNGLCSSILEMRIGNA
ncbi:hypothetical protein OPV22_013251 [Ensete ventricosum]|uniref:Uncharacterized protein n=1 Tax=Ensete ventricosum TaxID=4639 RepID=A0AAV8R7V7_ENSVE|nr:hypothetical protein OPV22_013251 [Ensete ventricosum]